MTAKVFMGTTAVKTFIGTADSNMIELSGAVSTSEPDIETIRRICHDNNAICKVVFGEGRQSGAGLWFGEITIYLTTGGYNFKAILPNCCKHMISDNANATARMAYRHLTENRME